MNAALLAKIGPSGLTKLAPLFGKQTRDLVVDDLKTILDVLNIRRPASPELLSAATALLQGRGIDTASDLIQSPEAVQELLEFLQAKPKPSAEEVLEEDERDLVRCPHCLMPFLN